MLLLPSYFHFQLFSFYFICFMISLRVGVLPVFCFFLCFSLRKIQFQLLLPLSKSPYLLPDLTSCARILLMFRSLISYGRSYDLVLQIYSFKVTVFSKDFYHSPPDFVIVWAPCTVFVGPLVTRSWS